MTTNDIKKNVYKKISMSAKDKKAKASPGFKYWERGGAAAGFCRSQGAADPWFRYCPVRKTFLETSKCLSPKGQKARSRAELCQRTLKYVYSGMLGIPPPRPPRISGVWAAFKRYLLSLYFSLAENRMRLQRTKSKEREKVWAAL